MLNSKLATEPFRATIGSLKVAKADVPKVPEAPGTPPAMKGAGSRYEGCSNKDQLQKPKDGELTVIQQMLNKAHNGLRAIDERGNSLLKMTFKATPSVPASQ